MPSTTTFIAFTVSALVLLLIPGPAVLFIVTRSVAQGRRAGLVSVLGLSTGVFVHLIAATLGLSALLVASATAFSIVKLGGAAYLIYLGVRTILATSTATDSCTDGSYALAAGTLSSRLSRGAARRTWPRYAAGGIYIGLGIASALAPRHEAA